MIIVDTNARRIARFQISGDSVSHLQDARGAEHLKKRVKQALQAKHPQLEDEDFANEEFNIEGFANQDDEFLIGLRSPIVDGKAMAKSVACKFHVSTWNKMALKSNQRESALPLWMVGRPFAS